MTRQELTKLKLPTCFFIHFRNPTPSGEDLTWTPATRENKESLLINEEPEMKTNLHGDRVKFWDDFLDKYRAMAINGVVKDLKDEL